MAACRCNARPACHRVGDDHTMRRKLDVLETSVKQLDDCMVELTVVIDADEVTKQIDAAYRQAAKARIPGFRPGKAPRRVLENNFGGREYFLATAAEELVRSTAPLAIDTEGLVALKEPTFQEFDLATEGQQFCYSLTLKTTPRFALSSYDPVKIELPNIEPTEEEIQKHIDFLREYYVEYGDVEDRGIQDGDSVIIRIGDPARDAKDKAEAGTDAGMDSDASDNASAEANANDNAFDNASDNASAEADASDDTSAEANANEITYVLGSNTMPPEFDEGLKGMKIGQTKEIPVVFDGDGNIDGTFKPVDFVVTIKAIRERNLPELTDAWVKSTIEYEDVAELRTRITESIKESKQTNMPSLRETRATEKLSLRLEGSPPEEMVKQIEQNNYQDFFKSIQDNHTTFDQYLADNKLTSEQFRTRMHEQAVRNANTALALDSLARHIKLEVSDDEVFDEFKNSGVENPNELFKKWKSEGRISEIREGLLRMKALQHLCDTAEVFEPGTLEKDETPTAKKPVTKTVKTAKTTETTAVDQPFEKEAARLASDEQPVAAKAKSASKSVTAVEKKIASSISKEPAAKLLEEKPRAVRSTTSRSVAQKSTTELVSKPATVRRAPTKKGNA